MSILTNHLILPTNQSWRWSSNALPVHLKNVIVMETSKKVGQYERSPFLATWSIPRETLRAWEKKSEQWAKRSNDRTGKWNPRSEYQIGGKDTRIFVFLLVDEQIVRAQ